MPFLLPLLRPRWRRISLRGLIVLVVVVGVPGAWVANTIRSQRLILAAIRGAGGSVQFDFEVEVVGFGPSGDPIYRTEPAATRWVRRWLGDELFQRVHSVNFPKLESLAVLASVARLDRLESLRLADLTPGSGGYAPLQGMTRLDFLGVFGPGATDMALAEVGAIATLQRLEVNSVTATDAGFAHLAALPNLTDLGIDRAPNLTDQGTAQILTGLPRLRHLILENPGVPVAATVRALASHHRGIEDLRIGQPTVTDADLQAIGNLTQLKLLSLQASPITATGVAHLRPLQALLDLNLAATGVTDSGLAALAELSALRTLNLASNPVTDAGLQPLIRLPYLAFLDLAGTKVTAAGLATLARNTTLISLSLTNINAITDAALTSDRIGPNLRTLNISSTSVTPAGIAALAAARPGLRIIHLPDLLFP